MRLSTRKAKIGSALVACALGGTIAGAEGQASAFCRTTTVPISSDFVVSEGHCWDQGFPVWWRNRCVGYSLNEDASRMVTLEEATSTAANAFALWSAAVCSRGGNPSIEARDLGPVSCNEVRYNETNSNQNVIVFDDDVWPHNDSNNVLALTTVFYVLSTGELRGADMEINEASAKITATGQPGTYDLRVILTHETGHFFGLAHSDVDGAVMDTSYNPSRGQLLPDDIAGICTIYTPDGMRAVADGGTVSSGPCDPTPTNGFAKDCVGTPPPQSDGCSCATAAGRGGGGAVAWGAFAVGLGSVIARRRRRG